MNLDDMKFDWQRTDHSGTKFDELAATVRQRGAAYEAGILRRDRIEMASSVFVLLFAIPGILKGPNWLFRIGFILIVLGTMEVMAVMTWARRKDHLPAADVPLRKYCEIQLKRIDRQIRLLEGILWWYLLPLMIGAPLVFLSVSLPWFILVIMLGLSLSVCIYVHRLNRNGAKNQLRPLRDSFAAVLEQLDAKETDRAVEA